jgi:hypothetical protein
MIEQLANPQGMPSWESIIAIVTPMVGGGVLTVKWLMSRADADRADSAEDRRALRDSLDALRKAVDAASASSRVEDDRSAQIVQTQQRIVWAQERILALLERDLGISTKTQAEHRA